MPIPETVISDILNSVSIVDIVSQYVRLKKTGKNYVGLCPFHGEKTPSFSVSPEKNLFYCFGCGEGGNLFSFLMKYENISFPEAVEMVARQYGIHIPEDAKKTKFSAHNTERENILRINKTASDYFHYILTSTHGGKQGLEYLRKRKIPDSLIKEYSLGMSPEGWDNLLTHLRKKGFSLDLAEKAGLIIKRKSNTGYYDRFRSRLMFPIYDVRGDVLAFGGRTLLNDNPKYLNSPETHVYNKSRSLYGLKQGLDSCRKENQVYIVEGYMDVLALSKAGMKNSVASLGTSLTQGHVKMLKGYAEKMTLVYDGDNAGIKAAVRSIDIFANEEADVSVLVLPDKMDPDDYINKFGGNRFKEDALHSKSAVDFLTETWLQQYGNSIEGKIKVVSSLEPLLIKIKDPVTRSLYVSSISRKLDIPENAIFQRIDSNSRKTPDVFEKKVKPVSDKLSKIDLSLLSALIDVPELRNEFLQKGLLNKVENDLLRQNFDAVIHLDGEDPFSKIDSSIQPFVAKIKMEQGEWSLKQAKILLKQFEYSKKRKGLSP